MNIENTTQNETPKPIQHTKNKYLTISLNPDELDFVYEVRASMLQSYGQKIALNSVIRAMLEKGLNNIDFDACKEDPLVLFARGEYE